MLFSRSRKGLIFTNYNELVSLVQIYERRRALELDVLLACVYSFDISFGLFQLRNSGDRIGCFKFFQFNLQM